MFAFIFFCAIFLYVDSKLDSVWLGGFWQDINIDTIDKVVVKQDLVNKLDIQDNLWSVVVISVQKEVEYLFESGDGVASDSRSYLAKMWGGAWVVVDAGWYIVTSKHVVKDKEASYLVRLTDGKEYAVENVWFVEDKDLALLKIVNKKGLAPVGLIVANFCDDNIDLPLWSFVFAVGNLFSEYGWSVSMWVLSSKWIDFELDNIQYKWYYLTDTKVAPGSSGGPLMDIAGNVIGLVTAHAREWFSYVLPLSQKDIIKYFGEIIWPL